MNNSLKRGALIVSTLFLGSLSFAQSNDAVKPIMFKSVAEKEAWIAANPERYAKLKEEAEQYSSTYLGSLLVVNPDYQMTEVEALEREIDLNRNNPEFNLAEKMQQLERARANQSATK